MRGVAESFEESMRALARLLRNRRLSLGLTQEEVAYEAGLSVRHYQLLESDLASPTNNPRFRTLYNIAIVLETSIRDLIELNRGGHPKSKRISRGR